VSWAAGNPLSASAATTSRVTSTSISCRGERFTAIRSGASTSADQAAAWCSACRSTQRPISMMAPLSSASGMNSAGDTVPSCGWCQRTNASKPVVRPSASSTVGW
jgi:hypothetical protein